MFIQIQINRMFTASLLSNSFCSPTHLFFSKLLHYKCDFIRFCSLPYSLLPSASAAFFCFKQKNASNFNMFSASRHVSSLFLSSFPSLHIDITVCPSPIPLLASFSRFHVVVLRFFLHMPPFSVSFSVFLWSLSPRLLFHMLFSLALLCWMPVGWLLWMLHVLLCVSRAHSPLLLQLCWRMAPLTLRSAAVMVI